jgi:probable phosphoglycerate mutase
VAVVADLSDVVLVRHAATAWSGRRYCGRSDPPLSAAGRHAAAQLAIELGALYGPETTIVSSPARRARQTAEAVGAAIGQPRLVVDPRWHEADFGIADGRTFAELAVLVPTLAEQLLRGPVAVDWPDGESGQAFTSRVEAALATIAAAPGTTLVVTHAGPIRLVLARAGSRPASDIAVPEPASFVRLPLGSTGTRAGP